MEKEYKHGELGLEKAPAKNKGCLIAIASFILLTVIISFCINSAPKHDKKSAYCMAQVFIEKELSPRVLKFPIFLESYVVDLDNGNYKVNSYFDTQNGIGLITRVNFSTLVKYENDNWTYSNIEYYY